jgi:hypothetical protein
VTAADVQIVLVGLGLLAIFYIRYKTPQADLWNPLLTCPHCWTEGGVIERLLSRKVGVERTCACYESTWTVS